jgi:hypothetical protein
MSKAPETTVDEGAPATHVISAACAVNKACVVVLNDSKVAGVMHPFATIDNVVLP